MKVFLVPNFYKPEAVQSGLTLELWLSRQGYDVAWAPDQRSKLQGEPDIDGSDLVISLGGDGTLLRAVRLAGSREIPVLGISYGHLGFLTAASPEDRDVLAVVSDALSGEMHVSRRSMLLARVFSTRDDGSEAVLESVGLNDMALTRGPLSDMVEFHITVSGHHIDRLRGDGVVVSTATGSTGYALSAGGPIVSPDYKGLLCVPIAPHTIQARAFMTSPSVVSTATGSTGYALSAGGPIVSPDYKGLLCVPIAPHTIQARAFMTSPSDVVEVKMSTSRPSVPAIAVDGQFLNPEGEVDRVEVSRAPYDAMLLDYGPESFYSSVSRVFYGVRRHD